MPAPEDTTAIYDRAGFGRRVERGARPAVVVVDLTYGFTDPAQPTGADLGDVVRATRELIDVARAGGTPVVFTTIAYDEGAVAASAWVRKATGLRALRAGSRLAEVDARLGRRDGEHLVVKHGASAFFGTGLAAILASRRVDTVIVTGATTSGCVRATAVDAVQSGYPVLVPRECVGDRARGPHEASLFDIDEKYGDVVTAADVASYLNDLPRRVSIGHP
ncbi:nicotinamidase-related amidase [Thermocatellispora tengchongensis]|uniref:Nicotinamidase-related amidase n=1 Tax=Thermocatellispora tengchongensis TaxID=1073253 RepID=A0A840PE71_9ACTN|nr:isochorismatase family protein [Thermocatellispora tengchongensis]MBB5137908.1 nicotinamidase-related amidase [Thermocatellispora tengchongensis]